MNRANLFLFIPCLVVFIQCTGSNEQLPPKYSNYEFEIVDSVVLDRLSEVQLLDYNERDEELLIVDTQTREVLVIDENGIIQHSIFPFFEGPNYMGDRSFDWHFHGPDSLVGYGQVHFSIFTKEGKQVKRIEYPESVGSWTLLDYDPKMVFSYPGKEGKNLLAMITGVWKRSRKSQAYQDSVSMVYKYNLRSEMWENLFQKPPYSTYRKEKAYIDEAWPLMTHLGGGKFALTYESDKYLYIMDADEDKIIDTLLAPQSYQPKFESVPFGSKNNTEHTKVNTKLLSTGDHVLLRVTDVIPESVMSIIKKGPRWWESDEYKQASKTYSKTYWMIFNRHQYLGELTWDVGKTSYDPISTENGFIWLQRVYDEERDYRTFLKVRVAPSG